ncbi:hypothetical protein GCM10028805_02820 [Spirosoma harenae]
MLRIYVSVLLSLFSKAVFSTQLPPPDSLIDYRAKQSISAQIGTTGPGLFYNRVLSPSHRLSLRIGGQYIAYQQSIRLKATSDGYIDIKPDAAIGIAQAAVKWHPFARSSFFLVGGLGYTWHPNLSFVLTTQDKLDLDGIILTPEDVGTVKLDILWHPVVGYLGGGFGRSIPKSRFGVGFEMGVYYLGKPSLNVQYEGFLETTTLDQQLPIIERNLSNYRYLPSLNLTLTYKL